MPLSNDKEKLWDGWLADGLGDKVAEVQRAMIASLQSRDMPKTVIRPGTVNMWWRQQSTCIDLSCDLDGRVNVTIHIQPFGSSMWIGRAVDGNWIRDNYYKRMAARAFLETVDRSILETLESAANGGTIKAIKDRPEPAALA
jgi:hypothetical protein